MFLLALVLALTPYPSYASKTAIVIEAPQGIIISALPVKTKTGPIGEISLCVKAGPLAGIVHIPCSAAIKRPADPILKK
jgi:hypothetical protein